MRASPSPRLCASTPGARSDGISPFLAVTFGLTGVLLAPAALSLLGVVRGPAERFVLPAVLATFAPLLAALWVARAEPSDRGAIFRQGRSGSVSVSWYLVALAMFPVVYVVGTGAYALLGGTDVTWLYPPRHGQDLAAMIVVPLAEEPAWRGFALPRMQARLGAIRGSLALGAAWGLYLACKAVVLGGMGAPEPGVSFPALALSVANVIAASVVFAWLYGRTRGSVLVAVVAHVGLYLDNPYHALPGDLTPLLVYTLAMGAVAGALVLFDRRAWPARTDRTSTAPGGWHGPIPG